MKVVNDKRNSSFISHCVNINLSMKPLPERNDQWFSGDPPVVGHSPSAAILKARIFGRDDRVIVYTSDRQYSTFFQRQSFMPAAFPHILCHPEVRTPVSSADKFGRQTSLPKRNQAICVNAGAIAEVGVMSYTTK